MSNVSNRWSRKIATGQTAARGESGGTEGFTTAGLKDAKGVTRQLELVNRQFKTLGRQEPTSAQNEDS
jgi:hypothetical protein